MYRYTHTLFLILDLKMINQFVFAGRVYTVPESMAEIAPQTKYKSTGDYSYVLPVVSILLSTLSLGMCVYY